MSPDIDRPAHHRVVVSGWYGCGNVGDDALLLTIVQELRSKYGPLIEIIILAEAPERVLAFFPGDPQVQAIPHYSFLRRYGVIELFARGAIVRHLRTLRRSDLFVLGGGGLVQDANGVRNLFRYLDDCVLARWCGTRTILLGVGIGPLVTRRGRLIARTILNSVDCITVRDQRGKELLERIGLRRPIVHTSDPALLLEARRPASHEVESALARIPSGAPLVAVCPRERVSWSRLGEPAWTGLLLELARLCDGLVEELGAWILFVPFMRDDLEVIDAIRARMGSEDRCVRLDRPPEPRGALGIIGRCRYVVGMRLHSLIFAASEGVPPIGINYAPKVRSFFEDLGGHGLVLEEAEADAARCLEFVRTCERDYGATVKGLKAIVDQRKASARVAFQRLFDLLDRG